MGSALAPPPPPPGGSRVRSRSFGRHSAFQRPPVRTHAAQMASFIPPAAAAAASLLFLWIIHAVPGARVYPPNEGKSPVPESRVGSSPVLGGLFWRGCCAPSSCARLRFPWRVSERPRVSRFGARVGDAEDARDATRKKSYRVR